MRKVFVLMHKDGLYSSTSTKAIRAFEDKEAADRMLEAFALIVKGNLEVVEVDFEEKERGATALRVGVDSRIFAQPSILAGVGGGRAELP